MVSETGFFHEHVEKFSGLKIWDANKRILETLEECNTLLDVEKINHSTMHCWRHKSATIYKATEQWFISMDTKGQNNVSLRETALQEIEQGYVYSSMGQKSANVNDRKKTRLDNF